MSRRFRSRIFGAAIALAALGLVVAPAEATTIVKVTSPGGIEAWLVREPSIPIVSLEVAWRDAGAKLDPEGKSGLANLAADLLDEGAGDLDSQAFHAKAETIGIELGFAGGHDHFRASLRTLAVNRDAAFQLLSLAVSQPRFDPEPLDRVRKQLLSMLDRQEEEPEALASRALLAAAYPNHPYGRAATGTPADLGRITREDLQNFVHGHIARDNMVIGVVGDIAPAELGLLLDGTFGTLPAKASPERVAEVEPAAGRPLQVINRNIPQSVVDFAGPGIKRSDPDFYAAFVLSHVLGSGTMSSVLSEEVRIKRGLVYSIYLQNAPSDESAITVGGFATRNEKVGEALALVRAVLARVREQGISAAELANAKTYLNGSFPLTLSSNARIANFLVTIQLERLGIDYLERRPKLIDAVTLDDVARVARRMLNPDKLLVVVIGKPEGIGG